ncbi:hypothetical protein BDZ97DRAFT_1913105 [Flammula alnicola]|nr:hypothetical protein BDZ97DRAFT_1913105 [Flammula alnicola]
MNCVGPNDRKVVFPSARLDCLPDIYIMLDHPKHSGHGRAYYFVLDGSPAGLSRILKLEENVLRVPNGSEEDAIAKGYLKLEDGDIIFARLASSPQTGEKDVAVVWVNGRDLFSYALRADTVAARDALLGPKELRSRTEPRDTQDGVRIGGTAWERTNPTKVRGGRCYAFGMSFQSQKSLCSPCADGKVKENDEATLKMRAELIRVTTAMAVRAIRSGPEEIMEHLDINAELLNIPSVGVNGNSAFAAAQLNLAPTRPSTSVETLQDSMGSAGEAHVDSDDSPGHYSHMAAVSDLPEGFDPGRFFVLYPGVFITLDPFSSVCFSGLRRHGSSPPIVPPAATADELSWATRVTLISYPPKGMTGDFQKRPLGALGLGNVLYTTPEMITPEPKRLSCNPSTFAEDGRVIIPRLSLVAFLAKSFLTVVLCILAQLDPLIGVRVDSDAFLGSFSFANEDGHRQRVGPWRLGPGWRSPNASNESENILHNSDLVSQKSLVADQYAKWRRYYRFYSAHIPFAVCSGSVPALEEDNLDDGEDEVDPPSPSRPRKVARNAGPSRTDLPPSNNQTGGNVELEFTPRNRSKGKNKADSRPGPSAPNKRYKKSPLIDSDDSEPREDDSDVLYLAWSGSGYDKLVASFGRDIAATSSSSRNTRSHKRIDLVEGTKDCPMIVDDDDEETADIYAPADSEIPAHRAELPTYIKSVTSTVIKSEYNETHSAAMEILTDSFEVPLSESMNALQAYHVAITNRPLDVSSVPLLRSSWVGVSALQASERANSLLLRKQRSCIMFTAYTSWLWLHVFIPQHIHAILNETNTVSVAWLSSLIDYVECLRESGAVRATFSAQSCGLDLPDTQCVIDFGTDDVPDELENYNELVADTVVEVLGNWLAYPSGERVQYQAYFVHVLLRDIGHDILTLDAVWKIYQTINRRSFLDLGPLTFDATASPVRPDHPIFDSQSVERKNIGDIASVVERFVSGQLVNRTDIISNNVLPVDVAPPQLTGAMNRRLSSLRLFVSDCYLVVFKGIRIPNDRLYQALHARPDYYIPFREHAPTRDHMRDPGGPFGPSHLRTTEGLFSAIVGRAITFGTGFSRTGKTLFTSANDFHAACGEMGDQDDRFFCDPAAYGRHNHKKTTDLADIYWSQLQQYQWPGLSCDGQIPFMECFRFFKPPCGPARFPELGNLAAYLLTADYVYAEAVCPPTEDEMGHMVQLLNKGATNALEFMGFIPARRTNPSGSKVKPSVRSCVDGFHRAVTEIAGCIDESEHTTVGVDYIMAEHTLCKFTRAISDRLVSV